MTCYNFNESDYFFKEQFLTFPNLYENDKNESLIDDEDERRYYIHNSYISQDNIRPFINTNYNFENRTSDITDKRLKNLIKNIDNAPPFYSLNTIRGILIKNVDENDSKLFDKIIMIKDENISELKEYIKFNEKNTINNFMYHSDNISKQENFINLEYKENEEKNVKGNYTKKKRGRIAKNNVNEEHNRYDADNIIIKLKAKLFNNCLDFLNRMINKNAEGIKLLKIYYDKYINHLNRKKNLDLFEMPLADLFSLEISKRYITKRKDYNKIIIKEILEKKIEIEDYDTIEFLFKITLNDWINLFTYKKDIYSLGNEYDAKNVNYTKIEKNFIGVKNLLNEISEENDDKYYTLFLLYAFNFQRWFYIKKGRVHRKKGE